MADTPIRRWAVPVPWFRAPTPFNPEFTFSSLGGRFVALVFFGDLAMPGARDALGKIAAASLPRADDRYVLFGITRKREDASSPLIAAAFPENRLFLDESGEVSRLYGAEQAAEDAVRQRPHWLVLDPNLRVIGSGPLDRIETMIEHIRHLPPARHHAGVADPWAPVLLMPRILETDFCRELVAYYERHEPRPSGTMRERDGITVEVHDTSFKSRADVHIADEGLRQGLRERVNARLVPEIKKAFQFEATRIERYIVACYSAKDGGYFHSHRDNTTRGTAHRRFAVTINLNAEDYDGGTLSFPEFGDRQYKAPTGGAIVFSCSLLHRAHPVTRGERYATLPFLYDDAAAKIREENLQFVAEESRTQVQANQKRAVSAETPAAE